MRRQQWTGERSCQASTMVYCNVQMESIKMFCVKSSLRRLLLAKLLADWLRPANRWKDKRTFLNCMCGAGETSATSHSLALSVRSQPWAARFMHKFSSHCFSIGARARNFYFSFYFYSHRVCVCVSPVFPSIGQCALNEIHAKMAESRARSIIEWNAG